MIGTGNPGDNTYSVVVAGSGSMGRRHMRNLRALGVERIAACDPSPERLAPMERELGIAGHREYEEALNSTEPDAVFVCSPPAMHVSQALSALRRGAHVFIEKPLSHSIEGLSHLSDEARLRQRVVQIGYNLRFNPGLQKVKEWLTEGIIGRPLWARAEVGQYLPDWRPWQDYRQSYTARRALGGGIILDASHEIDYIVWLLGAPSEVMCMAGKVSDLEIDAEDCATVLIRFENGIHADVHMDCIQRSYSRHCTVAGELGTIRWDYESNCATAFIHGRSEPVEYHYSFDPNFMYISEVEHFFECIASGASPLVGLDEATLSLRVALAAHESAHSKRTVTVNEDR